MYGIHFGKEWKFQCLKILIGSIDKNSSVCNLCFVALTGFKFHFAFQIRIPCCEEPLIEVGIKSPDRKIQLRMVGDNLVRRLSLLNERRDDSVFFTKFLPGKIDSSPGIRELFTVFSIRKSRIVCIFVSDSTVINRLRTPIADIRGPVQTIASFLFKVLAGLIACGTGRTLHTTKNELAAGIGFSAMIAMDAEVLSIIKGALMVPVGQPVSFYLF